MKRTNLYLDRELVKRAKVQAAIDDTSLSKLVNAAIEKYIRIGKEVLEK